MPKNTIDKNDWYKGVARELSFFMTHEIVKGYNNMFCIYFGYANERSKIKKITDKYYDLVAEVRNGINDLQTLDDFLKRYFPKIDLSEFTADEIKVFLETKKLPPKKELDERRKEYLLLMKNLKVKRIFKKDIKSILAKYVASENYARLKELKGQIVFKKNVSGPARIVLKKKDLPTIQTGEILVTIMTNPDFVPYLSKVIGIVTDYGGITCHASIISREMNIPCIVGTKIATKIFKNGDIINIDSNNQSVKT